MGEVVEIMPRLRLRAYQRYWDAALTGERHAVQRLIVLMKVDPDFAQFCDEAYRKHVAMRERQDDGA